MKIYQIDFHKTAFHFHARFELSNGETFNTRIEDHAAHQIIKFAEIQDCLRTNNDNDTYVIYEISL